LPLDETDPHGRFVFGTITAPVKDTITASYHFRGTITAPIKNTITASYHFHGITAPQETRFIAPIHNRYDCYLG